MKPRQWIFSPRELFDFAPAAARRLAGKLAGVSPDTLWADDGRDGCIVVRNSAALQEEQDAELATDRAAREGFLRLLAARTGSLFRIATEQANE